MEKGRSFHGQHRHQREVKVNTFRLTEKYRFCNGFDVQRLDFAFFFFASDLSVSFTQRIFSK